MTTPNVTKPRVPAMPAGLSREQIDDIIDNPPEMVSEARYRLIDAETLDTPVGRSIKAAPHA